MTGDSGGFEFSHYRFVSLSPFSYFNADKRLTDSGLMRYFFCLLLGYCIGSFPTAYLLVKWKRRVDLRHEGSGSIGAMNTFDVTGSKGLGFAVLAVDLMKGILAVLAAQVLAGPDFRAAGSAGLGTVLGHNFSPWLRFRGGRGLATAAGVMGVLGWPFVPLWCAVWAVVYGIVRHIHVANVAALVATPIAAVVLPVELSRGLSGVPAARSDIALLISCVCAIALVRHIRPIAELLKSHGTS